MAFKFSLNGILVYRSHRSAFLSDNSCVFQPEAVELFGFDNIDQFQWLLLLPLPVKGFAALTKKSPVRHLLFVNRNLLLIASKCTLTKMPTINTHTVGKYTIK